MAIITVIYIVLCLSVGSAEECPVNVGRDQAPHVIQLQTNTTGLNDNTTAALLASYLQLEHTQHKSFITNLAVSCKQIVEVNSNYKSGYYWIQGKYGAVVVYCEMSDNITYGELGGWMRIATVDIRNNNSQCPQGLELSVVERRRLCVTPPETGFCTSTIFNTRGVEYRRVLGRVIGYQHDFPNGFGPSKYTSQDINGPYVDGVSITHGLPRQHIWTLAAARDKVYMDNQSPSFHEACPCLHPSQNFTNNKIPEYVGQNYYCETGSRLYYEQRYYFDDPLWDGEGCTGENECCNRGGPWFRSQLNEPTQDNIELRICGNSKYVPDDPSKRSDRVELEKIELYVQ